MLTDATWETFCGSGKKTIKQAVLKPDENGWKRKAVLMPQGTDFIVEKTSCVYFIEIYTGRGLYQIDDKIIYFYGGKKVRIPSGTWFGIIETFTEVLWVISYAPTLQLT